MSDAAQIHAWMRELARSRSTTATPVPGGVALLSADFPLAHDHNLMLLWESTDAGSAADAADSTLREAGLDRLAIEVRGDALADALEPGLVARGYERSDVALMRLPELHPVEPLGAGPVIDEIGIDERAEAGTASWLDESGWMPAEEVRQLGERIRSITAHVDATFLAVRGPNGVPIAHLDLYVRGGIAQLEELYTLRRFRGTGIASALIREGIRRATASGPSIVFLAVDEDGGPGRLYERFGFETFGRLATFAKDTSSSRGDPHRRPEND